MRSIPQAILERSQSLSEGGVLAPKEFLHLGSRAAVDQAFCRLAKAGQLMRIARGIYVAPVREKDQARAPSAESLAKSIAAQGKQCISLDGAQAARSMGLTRAASTKEVYLTTGRSKRLVVGSRTIYFQHAPYWLFSLGATPAGGPWGGAASRHAHGPRSALARPAGGRLLAQCCGAGFERSRSASRRS